MPVPAAFGSQSAPGPHVTSSRSAGATVSTTLDSATTTTDDAGNFDLTTTLPRSQVRDCRTYTMTITAAGLPTYTVSVRGFSGNEQRQLKSTALLNLAGDADLHGAAARTKR